MMIVALGIEKTLAQIQEEKLYDSIEIYTRGETLLKPILCYNSNSLNNYMLPQDVISSVREDSFKQTISTFMNRYNELKEDMEQFGFAKEEGEQLDQILEMYNKYKNIYA